MALMLSLRLKVVPSAPAVADPDNDYSDPFDARPDPRIRPDWEPKSAPPDCCSYMEPFEAQRIITGQSRDLSHSFAVRVLNIFFLW